MDAFSKLYNDFLSEDPQKLISLNQVCTYVKKSGENALLENLELHSKEHATEVIRLLKICLAEFAAGFAMQKGDIFGFADEANDDTGTVLKISNLGEEGSVGFVNYEIGIREKVNINCVSKKMVLNKSFDLFQTKNTQSFKRFAPIVQEIKDLKMQWNDKMKALQQKGYTERIHRKDTLKGYTERVH